LKTKHATPKYGLIFNASLVGQAAPKLKGKISRSLAAKSAISVRYDALGDAPDASIGFECRAKVGNYTLICSCVLLKLKMAILLHHGRVHWIDFLYV
jgi:hypothetical protein